MASHEAVTVVLLPIKPQFAQPIMDGRKRVEFCKARFSQAPTHVAVYASSPMKRILGFFEVDEMDVDAPDVGCIDQAGFRDYYGRRDRGVALGVGRVTALERPLELAALGVGARPPQSFMYLDESLLALFASARQP